MIPSGVIAIEGDVGTAKSSIMLTFPKKLKVFDLDAGVNRAWGYEGLVESGEVEHKVLTLPAKSLTKRWEKLEGYTELWREFTTEVQQAMERDDVQTVAVDTGTLAWTLDCDGYLQEIQKSNPTRKQLQQIEYGEPNARMKTLMDMAKVYSKLLVICYHDKPEYAPVMYNNKPVFDENGNPKTIQTGNRILDGFKYSSRLAEWHLKTWMNTNGDGSVTPMVKIIKSGKGIDLIGMEFEWFNYNQLEELLVGLGRIK